MSDGKPDLSEFGSRMDDTDYARDVDGALECTNCPSNTFVLSELGRVGPKDYIGVTCGRCGTPQARVTVDEIRDGFESQLRE